MLFEDFLKIMFSGKKQFYSVYVVAVLWNCDISCSSLSGNFTQFISLLQLFSEKGEFWFKVQSW